jgi:hypothetical protein
VAFKGIAAITSILGPTNAGKPPVVTAGMPGGVKRVVTETPHYVYAGEEVFFESNSQVTIKWVLGFGLNAAVKQGFKDGGTIYINYADAGSYRAFDRYAGNPVVQAIVGPGVTGLGFYLLYTGTTTGAVMIGAPVAIAIGVGIGIYEIGKSYLDPLFVQAHSRILIGIDEGYSVYTVEGTASLYNMDGDTIDVTTGKTATMSKDGDFGEVTSFDESDLSEELRIINDSMAAANGAQSGTSSGQASDGSFSIWLVIGGIVVVLLAGAIFIVLRKRKG